MGPMHNDERRNTRRVSDDTLRLLLAFLLGVVATGAGSYIVHRDEFNKNAISRADLTAALTTNTNTITEELRMIFEDHKEFRENLATQQTEIKILEQKMSVKPQVIYRYPAYTPGAKGTPGVTR